MIFIVFIPQIGRETLYFKNKLKFSAEHADGYIRMKRKIRYLFREWEVYKGYNYSFCEEFLKKEVSREAIKELRDVNAMLLKEVEFNKRCIMAIEYELKHPTKGKKITEEDNKEALR